MKCWKSTILECKDCGHRPDCDAYQSHERYKRRCFELTGENTELQQRLEVERDFRLALGGLIGGTFGRTIALCTALKDAEEACLRGPQAEPAQQDDIDSLSDETKQAVIKNGWNEKLRRMRANAHRAIPLIHHTEHEETKGCVWCGCQPVEAEMMLPAESTQQRCNCYQVAGKQCDSCRRKEEHE
jgi:hypothetical protein